MGLRECAVWRHSLLLAFLLSTTLELVRCSAGPHSVPHGYSYHGPERIGRVVEKLQKGLSLRVGKGVEMGGVGDASSSYHHTVLMTSDGHVYTSRLPFQPARRRLASEPTVRLEENSARLSPDLECEGCPETDIRVRVQNSKVPPYSAVGMIQRHGKSDLSGQVAQCSGTLIGDTHVLTAAHCLVDSDTWSQIGEIDFFPGVNGAEVFPSVTAQYSRVLQQYVDQGNVSPTSLNYDFGLITLKTAAPKGTTQLKIAAGSGTAYFQISTAGYPGDKAEATLWSEECGNLRFEFQGSQLGGRQYDNIVQHTCVAYNGQSGSGLWDNNGTVRAVLTGVLTTNSGRNINTATELNPFVYNTLAGWINEDKNVTYLPLAPPSPPTADEAASNWIRDHLYVPVVPSIVVVLVVIAVVIFCCSCLPRLRRRQVKARPQQQQVWVNGMGQPVQWPAANGHPVNGHPYPPPNAQFPHQWNPAYYGPPQR